MSRVRRPRLVRKRYCAEKTREKARLENAFRPCMAAILPPEIAIRKSANASAGRANGFAMRANAIADLEMWSPAPANALPWQEIMIAREAKMVAWSAIAIATTANPVGVLAYSNGETRIG